MYRYLFCTNNRYNHYYYYYYLKQQLQQQNNTMTLLLQQQRLLPNHRHYCYYYKLRAIATTTVISNSSLSYYNNNSSSSNDIFDYCINKSIIRRNNSTTTTTITRNVKITKSNYNNNNNSRHLIEDGLTFEHFLSNNNKNNNNIKIEKSLLRNDDDNFNDNNTNENNDNINNIIIMKFYIKTYGCQMNVNDSDIVRSILIKYNNNTNNIKFVETNVETDANIILTNTCAIRENAEQKVFTRLYQLRSNIKKKMNNNDNNENNNSNNTTIIIGVLGCMAKRLQDEIINEKLANLIIGPDSYRELPKLIADQVSILQQQKQQNTMNLKKKKNNTNNNNKIIMSNVNLSKDETYEDIIPYHRTYNNNPHISFVSIQRGCSNHCSFCIVPYTRGIERSRPLNSIINEIKHLKDTYDIKEVTLLGQNVNSYHDTSINAIQNNPKSKYILSNDGFRSRIKRDDSGYFFADLLHAVSQIDPDHLRVRFTSPHPKDYPHVLLQLMAGTPNICNQLHMPAQSGSNTVLQRMKRGYTREAYIELINTVHDIIPDIAISSDFIVGFCNETELEFNDTISLMDIIQYDYSYMYKYSMRKQTHAGRTMHDNIPEDVKQQRLEKMINTFYTNVREKNIKNEIGKLRLVLVEGKSKKSNKDNKLQWHGRTDQNKRIVFPIEKIDTINNNLPLCYNENNILNALQYLNTNNCNDKNNDYIIQSLLHNKTTLQNGDYAVIKVTEVKGHTLHGELLWKSNSITSFTNNIHNLSGGGGINNDSLIRAKQVQNLFNIIQQNETMMTQKTASFFI